MTSLTFFAALTLSIAYVPTLVNAAPSQAKAGKQEKRSAGPTLDQFMRNLLKDGKETILAPRISRVLGIEPNLPSMVREHDEDDCADKAAREARVFYEKDGQTGGLRVIHLVLLVDRTEPQASVGEFFRLEPNGTLAKALRSTGVEIGPDEARRLLKRELDFWLNGIGLKKKPSAEPSKIGTAGAETSSESPSESPLHQAAEKGDLDEARSQLAAGAKIDERDGRGWTALTHAAAGGHAELVKEFIKAGADINAAAKDGTTPLLAAAVLLRPEVVEFLLDSNAERNLRDANGDTALMKACTPGAPTRPLASLTRIGLALVGAGADPNARNQRQWTPLMSAAAACNEELVKALLAAGADPRAALPNGRSTLFFARGCQKSRIARLLQEAGASE
ncbi:MAG: ankyrin repeat domain-containing protein [Elusimicrobia bacterium]|nr:ankyrin repeat domain-containing protein [Elusimicrobiota bacterium]